MPNPSRLITRLVLVVFVLLSGQSSYGQTGSASSTKLELARSGLPLGFEENHGQAPDPVDFVVRTMDYQLLLRPTEAAYVFPSSERVFKKSIREIGQPGNIGQQLIPAAETPPADIVRIRLLNARTKLEATGVDRLPGRSHYLRGGGESAITADRFRRVRYREAYPGIDVEYHADRRGVEHDFIVKPGADPSRIRVSYEGVLRLALESDGDLSLYLPGRQVCQTKPVVYQVIDGERTEVEGAYQLAASNEVRFEIGEYDPSRELVIDPVIRATYLGGAGAEVALGIDTDSDGNVYVTGATNSIQDFPLKGPAQATYGGGQSDIFVTKLSPDLTTVLYSTFIGGSGGDQGIRIAADANGRAWVAGTVTSPDFPVTPGAPQMTFPGQSAVVVVRLSPAGDALEISTFLGGSGQEFPYGLLLDDGGGWITGWTTSPDFFTSPGAFQTALAGGSDLFLTRVENAGAFAASTLLGGSANEIGRGLAQTVSGRVCVSGTTGSADLPVTANALQAEAGGGDDALLACFNAGLSGLDYSTYLGGSNTEDLFTLASSPSGQLALAGTTESAQFLGQSDPQLGGSNGFLLVLRTDSLLSDGPAAGALRSEASQNEPPVVGIDFVRLFGGAENDPIFSLASDLSPGGAFRSFTVVGNTDSELASTVEFLDDCELPGELFVSYIVPGTDSVDRGCLGLLSANDVALTPNGNVLLGLAMDQPSLETTPGVYQPAFGGVVDAGVAEINGSGSILPFGGAVHLEQLTYDFGDVTKLHSGTGTVTVDIAKLAEFTKVSVGYVNAWNQDRWIIQNLYYNSYEDLDTISADFALQDPLAYDNNAPGPGVQAVSLVATFGIQADPLGQVNFQQPTVLVAHPVSPAVVNAQGRNDPPKAIPAIPARQNFFDDGENFAFTQAGSEINVQAAANQCVPAAIANSLAWLEARYDQFDVPHEHLPGLRGDNSLLGKLDEKMDRRAPSRLDGDGVALEAQFEGKFEYLAESGLADKLEQKHQNDRVGDYTAHGITTKNEGQQVTFEWLCDQVQRGEDVEMSWEVAGRGYHIVRVFGCGKTRGAAWVRYLHDRQQTNQHDPTDSLGLESKQGWLGHLDDDDRLNIDSVNTNLIDAASESLKPEIKQQPGAPPLTFGAALVNGASFAARALGPGALLSAFGFFPDTANAELRSEDASQSINLPTTLNGLTVRINGIAAPLFFAGPTQVNFQLPYEIPPGQATVEVVQSGKSSGFFTVPVSEAGPGIFPLDASIAGPGRGVIQNQDFSLNVPGSGAAPGEAIIVYVSGLGEMDNPVPSGQAAPPSPLSRSLAAVTVTIGGKNATVAFSGLTPGFVGLGQVNVVVPELPPGDHAVVVTAAGVVSNSALAAID